MKLKRSTLVPAALAVYLAVMAWIGWPEYAAGNMSALFYWGTVGLTIIVIVLLHFNLKRREQLRQERIDDINRQHKNQQ